MMCLLIVLSAVGFSGYCAGKYNMCTRKEKVNVVDLQE